MAYFGLAPETSLPDIRNAKPSKRGALKPVSSRGQGKVSRRGDRVARSFIIKAPDLHAVLQGHAAGMSVGGTNKSSVWKAVRQNHRFTCSQTAGLFGLCSPTGKIRQSQSGRTTLGAYGYGKALKHDVAAESAA